jgi:histone H3/H4
MPQQESYIDRVETLPPILLSPEFATMGKQCIEEFVNVQSELFENLQESNRHWLERVQSEAALASKFATKLTATRSVSDAMTTCQEWTSRQIEMIAEDSKLLVADAQRFIETGARLLWNDWWSNRPGGSA